MKPPSPATTIECMERSTRAGSTRAGSTGAGWLIPTGLIALSFIPVLGGALRIGQLTGGAQVTPENARFFASPVPIVVHIIGATLFCVQGAFQFSPGLRRRRPRWHRLAGRLVVPCGLAAALAGVWMTLFYDLPRQDQGLLTVFRLVFGSAMAACLVLGFRAILRRDIARHSAWMTRGYAIGIAAGTQALLSIPMSAAGNPPAGITRTLLLGLGWILNLAVAEYVIRRRRSTSARSRVAVVSTEVS